MARSVITGFNILKQVIHKLQHITQNKKRQGGFRYTEVAQHDSI